MKKIYAVLIFLITFLTISLGVSEAFAQNHITIKGKVTNEEGEPAAFVQVRANKGVAGGETDDHGNYVLRMAPADTITIEVLGELLGYKNATVKIIKPEGEEIVKNITMESEALSMGTVTIIDRFAQRTEQVTTSISLVSSKRLDQMASTDVINAMSMVPGVTIYDDQPSIRGSSGYTYGAGSRVLTLLNGLPMLSADRGSVNWDMLPTDNIEQVEVFKGASSVLYGSGAMGGVINVITDNPVDTPRTVIRLRTQMYGAPANPQADWDGRSVALNPSIHFFHSRKIKENFDFTAQIDLMHDSGYRQNEFSNRVRVLLMNRYHVPKIKGLIFGLNTQFSADSSATVIAWRNYPTGALIPGKGFLSLQMLYRLSLDPSIKYVGNDGSQHLYQGRIFHMINEINTGQSNDATMFYNEYQYQKGFLKDKLQVVAGINHIHNSIVSAGIYGRANGDQLAGYLQAKLQVGKRLNFIVGGRYQYETVSGDTAAKPENKGKYANTSFTTMKDPIFRGGVNWRAAEGTYVRGSWGQALRSPSVAERFTATFAGPLLVVPSPGIKIERGWTAEIGVKQLYKLGAAGKVKGFLDLSLFTMQFTDMVEFWADTERLRAKQVAFRAQNISNASVNGVEFNANVDAQVTKKLNLFFSGGITVIDPKDKNGNSAWNGDDSTSVIAQAAVQALAGNFQGQFPTDKPSILKYRNNILVRSNFEIRYDKWSLTTNWSYNSQITNVDKVFLIDLLEYSLVPGVPLTPEILKALNLSRLFSDVKRFRDTHPGGWHQFDFILAYDMKSSMVSFHCFNAFNAEYMTIPGTLGKQRSFAVQWKIKL